MSIYPIPLQIEESTQLPESDQVDLATVTELVEKLSESSEDETFLIKADIPEPEIQTENSPIQTKIMEESEPKEEIKMSVYQLFAILLIFCLLLFTLNVMWNNFYTTLFVCIVLFPILRWFGKV